MCVWIRAIFLHFAHLTININININIPYVFILTDFDDDDDDDEAMAFFQSSAQIEIMITCMYYMI